MLEQRWGFVLSTGSHPHIAAVVCREVAVQLGDVQGEVVFGGIDVVGLAVVVDKKSHVT